MTNGRRTCLALVVFGLGAAQGCGFFDSAYVPGVDDPIEEGGADGDDGDPGASAFEPPDSDPQEIQKLSFDDSGVEVGDGCDATCVVESGFVCVSGPDGRSSCSDIDECASGVHNCDTYASCSNSFGSFECACLPGFAGDGLLCEEVDECEERTDDCANTADCSNTIGHYQCACKPGYEGNGYDCSDIDECALGIGDCSDHADCINWEGGYSCDCFDGWKAVAGECEDVDECASGEPPCGKHAVCFNNHGSFQCFCDEGFSGDGFECSEISG